MTLRVRGAYPGTVARAPRLLALVALLAVAASPRGGCGPHDGSGYVPCGGKACGDACSLCAPGEPGCVETAVVKACDPAGACVPAGTFACPAAEACAGKRCGDACTIDPPCRSAVPPCLAPSLLGTCDATGTCVTVPPVCPPYDPCAGKACGASCDPCAPGATACPAIACVTACDGAGRCTCAGGGAACP